MHFKQTLNSELLKMFIFQDIIIALITYCTLLICPTLFSQVLSSSEDISTVVVNLFMLQSEHGSSLNNRPVSHSFSFLEVMSLSVELIGYCLTWSGLINSFPGFKLNKEISNLHHPPTPTPVHDSYLFCNLFYQRR